MNDITGMIITSYTSGDNKPDLSEEERLELKEFLDSVDLTSFLKSIMFSKPKVIHNYRYIKEGVVEHWITEL